MTFTSNTNEKTGIQSRTLQIPLNLFMLYDYRIAIFSKGDL